MPGGHLSHWFYLQLGGQREFRSFWRDLGLPALFTLIVLWFLLVQRGHITSRTFLGAGAALIGGLAAAVGARAIE